MNSTYLLYEGPLGNMVQGAAHQFTSKCIIFAMTTLVAYDHVLMLPAEITQIWGKQKSLASILFIITRYTLVTFIVLYDYFMLMPGVNLDFCTRLWKGIDVLSVIPFVTLPSVWILRTYAIWERSSIVPMILIPILIGRLIPTIFVYFGGQVARTTQSFLQDGALLCTTVQVNHFKHWALAAGSMAITFDSVVFLMTILRTYKWAKQSRVHGMRLSLHAMILRDGSLFFAFVAILNTIFICTLLIQDTPIVFASYSAFISCVFELVVTNRLILNLRDAGRSDRVESRPELTFTTVHTNTVHNIGGSSFLGNLGEYMHVYGDDNEDAFSSSWHSEKTNDSDETVIQSSDSLNAHDSRIEMGIVLQAVAV